MSVFSFTTSVSTPFGPRLGRIVLNRVDNPVPLEIDTPGFLITTSRGIVPHLSRDHREATAAIRWVHVAFESFLEHVPPVPTLQPGPHPLHRFLQYSLDKHVVSLSLRDPLDCRDMPPNGATHVCANCVRGVRKVTPSHWLSYAQTTQPDMVFALTDHPLTQPPHSQKRTTKSIERSIAWLMHILQPLNADMSQPISTTSSNSPYRLPNIFVSMAGGTVVAARKVFASRLMENLNGKEAEILQPFRTLDEGVTGYSFDLMPLRASILAETPPSVAELADISHEQVENPSPINSQTTGVSIATLLLASLNELPPVKLRLVTGVASPHETLRLIRDVGIDIFDAAWAQNAANIGIALDFSFPVALQRNPADTSKLAVRRTGGKLDLGHNLYSARYANDFSRLAANFLDGATASHTSNSEGASTPRCPCAACTPIIPPTVIRHSSVDAQSYPNATLRTENSPPYTRAYLHHLLHTHEMSAHALLTMHNLAVLDAFYAGIRSVLLGSNHDKNEGALNFAIELQRFVEVYDEDMALFDEAKLDWTSVDLARGKGRLARERSIPPLSKPPDDVAVFNMERSVD